VGGQSFAVHAAGERVILSRAGQAPEEIDLNQAPAEVVEAAGRPGREELPAAVCPHGAPEDGGLAAEPAVDPAGAGWPEGDTLSRLFETAPDATPVSEEEGGDA
jgi:hypothetical protein